MDRETLSPVIKASLEIAQKEKFGLLGTKAYRPNYLPNDEANTMPWSAFRERSNPLFQTTIAGTDLDVLVVPKSRTWSTRDVNIFMGSERNEIQAYNDFTQDEFARAFGWQVRVARNLSAEYNDVVHVSHGFNPQDTAPDAHSLRTKFHTHLYIPDRGPFKQVDTSELTWFDKLKLVEPYAPVFMDYCKAFLSANSDDRLLLQEKEGYFSITTAMANTDRQYFETMYTLLHNMEQVYENVVDIFTDRQEEEDTGHKRYILRPPAQREALMEDFLTNNDVWLSEKSRDLLTGLQRSIIPASPRSTPHAIAIDKASQLWIAKGFSGALNFAVSDQDDEVRFDFAPRVLSTSGATKFIGELPTIITKDAGSASEEEMARLQQFENSVVNTAAATL